MRLERMFTQSRPTREGRELGIAMRRVVAVFAVVGFPVLAWLIAGADLRPWIETEVGWAVYALGVAVLSVASVASWIYVSRFRRRLAQAGDDQLDEREVQVRDESHLVAYRIMLLIVLLVLVFGALMPATRADVVSRATMSQVGTSLLVIFVILPSAVVAWRDPGGDDLSDDVRGVARG